MNPDRPSAWNILGSIVRGATGETNREKREAAEHLDYANSLKGGRLETEREMGLRIAEQVRVKEGERVVADTNVSIAETGLSDAIAAGTLAHTELASQLESLAAARVAVRINPQDSGAQLTLLVAERSYLEKEKRLTSAEEDVSRAKEALALAQDVQAKVGSVNTERGVVDNKQRQLNYANSVGGKAGEQIRTYVGKGELARAVDDLNRAMKKKD